MRATAVPGQFNDWDGVLLVNKEQGLSSFGVIEKLQKELREKYGIKRSELPKMGHGGTLDPFATGLLAVCVGRAVKLARYFLGSTKTYEGRVAFGRTTIPGDPTEPVTETSDALPESREAIQKVATQLTLQPYLQTPPMHSAKKVGGKPLYELAREGKEIEREAKLCHLYEFDVLTFDRDLAEIRVSCSSGTYIRTLAQDLGRMVGTVAMMETLHRTQSGALSIEKAWTVEQLIAATREGHAWNELPCWLPFDRMLDGFDWVELTSDESRALQNGRQNVLFQILKRVQPSPLAAGPALEAAGKPMASRPKVLRSEEEEDRIALYHGGRLIGVANLAQGQWGIERVFVNE